MLLAHTLSCALRRWGRKPVLPIALSSVPGAWDGLMNIRPLNEIKCLILCVDLAVLKTRLSSQPSWIFRKKRDRSLSFPCSGILQDQGLRPASVSSAPSLPPAPIPLQHLSQASHWVPSPLIQLLVDLPSEKYAETQATRAQSYFQLGRRRQLGKGLFSEPGNPE